jgi:hypothetical protein
VKNIFVLGWKSGAREGIGVPCSVVLANNGIVGWCLEITELVFIQGDWRLLWVGSCYHIICSLGK